MSKTLGIDPGTKSFDLCGLEDGKVFHEKSLPTDKLAEDPETLIDAIEEVMPLDLIAGPSGYGVELTYIEDLELESFEDWYLTYILLLKREDLEAAMEEKDPGIMVYSAMTETALEMKRRDWPVCYLPGVINLSTVPERRKINNLDMGTVDKMCCCLLGIHDQAERLDIPYSETSFILVEAGHGYNAVLGVEDGKIVDGLGGTTNGIGFLSPGKIDLELAQIGGSWEKSDVFTGGASKVSGKISPREMIDGADGDTRCKKALNAMLEGIKKGVASMSVSVSNPKEILISGRLTRIDKFQNRMTRKLQEYGSVRKVGRLEGSELTKEAAQGYALAAEGISGGKFSELVGVVGIEDAEGTALDHIHHPKGEKVVENIKEAIPFRPR